jgi:hypothetical protein
MMHQRSILSNLLEECLINEWIHDNGGGMKLRSFTVWSRSLRSIESEYDKTGGCLSSIRQPLMPVVRSPQVPGEWPCVVQCSG